MNWDRLGSYLFVILFLSGYLFGCAGATKDDSSAISQSTEQEANYGKIVEGAEHDRNGENEILELPIVERVELQGGRLRVVATTSIIGDVVGHVGGTAIDLTTLMAAGQDPHSYQPGARELTAVADAHVIFVNGWDLEEALLGDLANIGGTVPVVPVSADIKPLEFGKTNIQNEIAGEDDPHSKVDPHVWFSVPNVEQWVDNITHILLDLDPDNATIYEQNATAYLAELAELEAYVQTSLATIPESNRFLVTNHSAFGYLAQAYDFEIIGTVIPGLSTLSEPSASDLTNLVTVMQAHQVCTIFTETTVSDQLAQVVADELNYCESVQVLPLYTGSLGLAGSGSESYLDLMRTNIDTIVAGLQSN